MRTARGACALILMPDGGLLLCLAAEGFSASSGSAGKREAGCVTAISCRGNGVVLLLRHSHALEAAFPGELEVIGNPVPPRYVRRCTRLVRPCVPWR